MRKLLMGLVWWFVIWIGVFILCGGIMGVITGLEARKAGHPELGRQATHLAVQELTDKYATYLTFGALVLAVAGTVAGILPGTKSSTSAAKAASPPEWVCCEGSAHGIQVAELPAVTAPQTDLVQVRGLWRVTKLFLFILLAGLAAQMLTAFLYGVFLQMSHPGVDVSEHTKGLGTNGFLLSLAICVSAAATMAACWHCTFNKYKVSLAGFLGLVSFRIKDLGIWTAIFLAVGFGWGFLLHSMGFSPDSGFSEKSYQTAGVPVLYWFAFVLAAPVSEEVAFRGYLIKSIVTSTALNRTWAVIISSAIWAAIHLQYNIGTNLHIFGLGLVLGCSRLKTGSLYVPIVLHMLQNLVAVSTAAFK